MSFDLTAERIRQVADALEESGVRFHHVCICMKSVTINDAAFEQMFAGCVLSGKRGTGRDLVEVTGEKLGITWQATLWRPLSRAASESQERVIIPAATGHVVSEVGA